MEDESDNTGHQSYRRSEQNATAEGAGVMVYQESDFEETTSSSAVQTTETQPIRPQETSTTSSSLNSSCLTDGNSTVTQPSDCSWQYNETHMSLKKNTQRNTSKLYIGLCIAAMILLTIFAAILTKKYLCGKRKVLQISKEPVTGTAQNGTSVRYQPHENLCFENDLYNVYQDPVVLFKTLGP
ncbi:hypothetical protein QTO34_016281 [Cnephaeus nilssonii]|uniref:Uncharacterized protein n=1 Tax=Cnephaeus nilssonii TaxID=3371016 RepID=A0AA40LRJ6_CNENI|nr:hypothetical protein QTO34_016281 [Eptesicus nilssonii]